MAKYREYGDKSRVIEATTFDELVQHGRDNGGNIVNGMPWSFDFKGYHVTHENDQLYLICKGATTLRLTREDVLETHPDGHLSVCSWGAFDRLYERHDG
jgi:hypothetical protein